ncbi:hypothetical protein EJB05_26688 [Eragrostis curvula]|uniref:Piwi domain-containing protein n=1 Tax=Eragrostis curvula TaxID=38414 RepID=A0A5J9ULZ8_9POAL|nr:hypothetical protein EJB05_26688 [Eragrostis curvula]
MTDMCEELDMEFSSLPVKVAQVASAVPGSAEKALRDELFAILRSKDAHIGFLLVILPDCRIYHAEVEEACEKLNVLYHCVLSYQAWPPCRVYLKDFVRQTKLKIVKHAMRLQRRSIPFVPEAPTIIFGADIFQWAPGERSIASVVAALNWPKVSKYETVVLSQPHNEGIIQDLYTADGGGVVGKLLRAFHSKTKRRAERIIFFRNSVTESQLDHIFLEEVRAIKQACASLAVGYEPPVTFLVVSPVEYEEVGEMANKIQQVHPETGDGENCIVPKPEFWCRHAGAKGFNSVVRYRVIYNENEITLLQLQAITKMLCTPCDRQTHPEICVGECSA